ncbi:MAG: TetR/AcrR family transcriptional regulator [Actinomycetota bacterium]|nr:TetR/AcrR family transcriptional regulator [Actinomycetota bacterium]MDZ4179604.1 TetR/AcrR family transcriptional regulator [Coriobacteriia bacterium]
MSAARNTEAKILQASAELIAERGYAATTTRAIAERACVNEVTLFRRFENKLGILRALGAHWAEEQAGFAVEGAVDPEDTRATLLGLARMEIEAASRNGGAALRLAFEARTVPEVGELLGEGPRQNMEGLAAYMRMRQEVGDLRADIDAQVLAEAFFALTSSYVMYRYVMGAGERPEDIAADRTIDQLVDVFWLGAVQRGDQDDR